MSVAEENGSLPEKIRKQLREGDGRNGGDFEQIQRQRSTKSRSGDDSSRSKDLVFDFLVTIQTTPSKSRKLEFEFNFVFDFLGHRYGDCDQGDLVFNLKFCV